VENAIMPNTSNSTFDTTWNRYARANARCLTLSGKALSKAQDAENVAVHELIRARGDSLAAVAQKLTALKDLLEMGEWTDHRERKLLGSIRRDVRALARSAS